MNSAPSKWARRRLNLRTLAAGLGGGGTTKEEEEAWEEGGSGDNRLPAGSSCPASMPSPGSDLRHSHWGRLPPLPEPSLYRAAAGREGCWQPMPRGRSKCQGPWAPGWKGEKKEATLPQNLCWAGPQKALPQFIFATVCSVHVLGWTTWQNRN